MEHGTGSARPTGAEAGPVPRLGDNREASMSQPLFVFAGGGSGGHLYPSLAVARELARMIPEARFAFFGTERAIDRTILNGFGGEWVAQRVRPLPRRPWHVPGFYLAWRSSIDLCRQFFRRQRPHVVLGSGGYASAPSICQAAREGIPTALLNPDAVPGKANRFLGSRVQAVFAQWEETAGYFNGRSTVHVTGCPIRPEFKLSHEGLREAGFARFGLDRGRRVLLITGASQGARTLNRAVPAAVRLPELRGLWQQWQLLHLTGADDEPEVRAAYREGTVHSDPSALPVATAHRAVAHATADSEVGRCGVRANVLAFTPHMAEAMAAADLVICRAGASTLAEVTAMGLPSILMPYPHHRDQHQVANARVLVRLGAARLVPDRVDPAVNAPELAFVLGRLLQDETERERMAAAARRIGTANAAATIAQHLLTMAEQARVGASAVFDRAATARL